MPPPSPRRCYDASAAGRGAQTDEAALARLVDEAAATHSDALIVRQHGRLVGEWSFGREPGPILTMSCTKSIVSLAVGALLDDGKLAGLDQPIADLYPEWRQGRKRDITVRHLLNHTSGLQNHPNASLEVESAPDWVQLALCAELDHPPGTRWAYNNKAVNLLAGVVQKASGQRLDAYLMERLLRPLGVGEHSWAYDRAGSPYAAGGLRPLPADFAKVGQLVLDRGAWVGRQVVSAAWIDTSLAQGQPFELRSGLLWFRIPAYEHYAVGADLAHRLAAAQVPAALVRALAPLAGRAFASRAAYHEALATARGVEPAPPTLGPIIGYQTNGYLGQYLVILPEPRIVAARLVRRTSAYDPATDAFDAFIERVRALA